MDYPNIKKLYKYTPFSARSISTLVTGKLWVPKPNTINDPFDCTIVNYSKSLLSSLEKNGRELNLAIHQLRPEQPAQSEIERKIYSLHDKFFSTVTERDKDIVRMSHDAYASLQSHIYSFGILSLSETARNILMWSHYGAHHTGMCFEFERRGENKLGTDAKKVTYSRSREINDQAAPDETGDLFFVKHSGWRYEREWRLLETNGDQLYDVPGRLTSVICGALMPRQDIKTIRIIVDALNANRVDKIAVKFAGMSDKKYSISISIRQAI